MLPYGRMECASYITSLTLCILHFIHPLFSNMAMLILKVRKKTGRNIYLGRAFCPALR